MSDNQQEIAPKRAITRYRVLWGKVPDPDADREEGAGPSRPVYREILNPAEPDGAYAATSAETARRAAFNDEAADQHPFIQRALRQHGVVLKHVALSSWGNDEDALEDPLRVATREDLIGRV